MCNNLYYNICTRCGKPIGVTPENPQGSKTVKDSYICTCTPEHIIGLHGWVCPVCGAGLSPYTSICPCTKTLTPMYYGNKY